MTGAPPPITTVARQLSNGRRKAELRLAGMKYRSPYPRSPKHGKHAFVQGDPNTREHNR